MPGNRKYWFFTLIWLVIIVIALLLPSPRGWGEAGERLGPQYSRIKHIIEPFSHVLFTAVLSFLLVKILVWKSLWHRLCIALMASVVLAVFLEASQSLLPQRFCRASDMGDLLYSVIGALMGCFVATLLQTGPNYRRKQE